jgi:hypothetical protein
MLGKCLSQRKFTRKSQAREVLLKGRAVIGNGSIFQEVRPEDKMATDL